MIHLYYCLWFFSSQGYLYSAASQLMGVEISSEFVKLQTMAVQKYGFSDRIQVIDHNFFLFVCFLWSLFCLDSMFIEMFNVPYIGDSCRYPLSGCLSAKYRRFDHEQRFWILHGTKWSNAVSAKPWLYLRTCRDLIKIMHK